MLNGRSLLFCTASVLVSIAGLCEEKPWREIRSPHFRVITNGSESAGRHVARGFEQMRAVFASEFPGYRLDAAESLIVIAPADEDSTKKLLPQYWKHSGPKPAGVFFETWEQPYALVRLDTVGSDRVALDEMAVVYHEYVHSLLHLNLHWLPTWLDEGLAEFYAYTRFEGDHTFIGAPPKQTRRLALLNYRNAIPLEKFMEQRGSFTRSEEDTELYYAQCWAFTHFLIVGPGMQGGTRLAKFFHALQTGTSQKTAFQDTFGDIAQVQKEFDNYIRLFAFGAGKIPTPGQLQEKDFLVRSLTLAQTHAELSSFLGAIREWGLARPAAELAVKEDPGLALAHQAMGFVDLREGKDEAATQEFSRAVELDGKMYRSLFAQTMLSALSHSKAPADQETYRLALLNALDVNPQFAPALIELAKLYVSQGSPAKALGLALRAEKLEPWRAGYHLLTGQILLRLNRESEAAANAAYVAEHWSNPDHDEAMELWNLIPPPKRPTPGPAPASAAEGVSTVEGTVRSVTCDEHGMTITLDKGGSQLIFRAQGVSGGFSDTLWFGRDHFTPCYHTAGLRAVIQYKAAAAKPYSGDVVRYGFRDDLAPIPQPAASGTNTN